MDRGDGPADMDDLTSSSYWDQRWGSRARRRLPRARKNSVLADILDLPTSQSASVLEIGCAPGSMLARMAQLRPQHHYHGLDYSERGLEEARVLLQRAGISAALHLGDYHTFIPDEPYDLVVSFGVLEHAGDPVAAIARHMGMARPGGCVAISLPNYSHPFVQRMARRIDPDVFKTHNVSVMDPEALADLMRRAGLFRVHIVQSGHAKVRTSCPQRTPARLAWRSAAKLWNIMARLLPPGVPWYASLWAIGQTASGDSGEAQNPFSIARRPS